ncbi:MAG: YaeQ family protein [Elusimicrobiota bacterium]|nr:YaeQ family protein [Elusimicrobiota bacterium]
MKANYIFSGGGKKIVVEKKRARTRSDVILKLLAHEMFAGRLRFSANAGFAFKPDLYAKSSGGQKALWADCFPPSEKRIMFFRSRADLFSVFVFLEGKNSVKPMEKLFKKHSVDAVIYAFDGKFVKKLAAGIYRKNSFKCVFSHSRVKVLLNGSEHGSPVYSNILSAF